MIKDDLKWAQQIRNDLFLFSAEPDFTEFDLNDLFKVLSIADDAYHNDTPIFEDKEYDALRLFCETAEPDNSYFLGVGSVVRGGKVKLPYSMGSLTQAYVGGDIQKWIAQHNLNNEEIVITEKLDGFSVLLVYGATGELQIAYSRGDGIEGADITRHVSKIPCVPKNIHTSAVIRAEIIFKRNDWDVVKTKIRRSGGQLYKNARNCVSGLMNASESDQKALDALSVVGYSVVSHSHFSKRDQLDLLDDLNIISPRRDVFPGDVCTDDELAKLLNMWRSSSEYEIDGIVLDVNDVDLRNQISPSKSTLNPEFARKFKVADASNQAIATVVEVQWNVSKNGYLKPRVRIEPVELVGVTVQHATGFNAKFIKDNDIGPGAKVRITRSGDVIPFIQAVVEPATAQMPEHDAEWTSTGVDLVIVNANDNDTVRLEQLIDFFAKVGTEYLGEGNLQTVFDAGFKTIVDVINLSEFEWTSMIGANGKKIYKSIREKLNNVPWYVVAGAHPAFGRGVGVRKMKKLYEAFAGDIRKLGLVNEIVAVEGFEVKTASKISAGYTKEFIQFLTDTSATITFAPYEVPKTGGLSGQTFLFTGFRSSDLEAKIVEQGGKISSSVSSKLTYLVAADVNDSSGKLKKARELGTKIISRDDLIAILGV